MHKVTLDLLSSTFDKLESNNNLLRALSTSELYGILKFHLVLESHDFNLCSFSDLCQGMTDIFHRQNQVTFALHTTPYMRQPWPFNEAVLIEPPPSYESFNNKWFSRSLKGNLMEQSFGGGMVSDGSGMGMRRVSSAPTNLQSPGGHGFAFGRKTHIMRWVFHALERLSVLMTAMKRTNSAYRDVLRLIEKEDLCKPGWDSSADARWERVRSCQALLPSAARIRWETFFVRESDYKACCKLFESVSRVHEMLEYNSVGPILASAGARMNPPLSEEAMVQAFSSLPPPETEFVRNCSAFADIAGDDEILLQMIVRAMRPVIFADSQIILREGTVATSMYLIKRGTCVVRVEGRTVAELRDGDLVGDAEIVRSVLRCADALAVGSCELLQLTRADLNELLIWHPALRQHLQQHSQARFDAVAAIRREAGLPPLPGATLAGAGRRGEEDGDDEWDGLSVAKSALPPADPNGPVLKGLRDLVLGTAAPAAQQPVRERDARRQRRPHVLPVAHPPRRPPREHAPRLELLDKALAGEAPP